MNILSHQPNGVIVTDLTFHDRVILKLIAAGADISLSTHDEVLIAAAIEFGVGPGDTAYQIIDDRDGDGDE